VFLKSLFLEGVEELKKSPRKPENGLSDALLMSRSQNFAPNAIANSFVYGAVTRRSAHELSHDQVAEEWCIAFDGILSLSLSLSGSFPAVRRLIVSLRIYFRFNFLSVPPLESDDLSISLIVSFFLSDLTRSFRFFLSFILLSLLDTLQGCEDS